MIVIGLGTLAIIPFHVVVREKNSVLKKLKWYKWLLKPNFYLVSILQFASKLHVCVCPQYGHRMWKLHRMCPHHQVHSQTHIGTGQSLVWYYIWYYTW